MMYENIVVDGFDWESLTPETIISDEVIEALGDPEVDEVEYTVNVGKYLQRAKAIKCLTIVKEFLRRLEGKKPRKDSETKQLPEPRENYVVADLGQKDQALCSGDWNVDASGIWLQNIYGRKVYACRKPVIITRELINVNTGKHKYELAFKNQYNKLITLSFPCAWLLNANKVQGLSDFGISMSSTEAKHFIEYLSDYIGANKIPIENSTDKLGWYMHDFVPYNRTITFDAEAQFNELYTAVMEHSGDPEAWVDFVQQLRRTNRSEIFISLAASFASPLLPLVNGLPFICNLYGTSGKGKTVCLYLAASIWGNCSTYISDSSNTLVANEIRLATLNHLPMLLDDFSKISSNKYVSLSDIIYSLCSGMGKSRSNVNLTLNEQKRWQCAILTNMERPLVESNSKGGSVNRVLDFQIEDGPIFQNGNQVVSFLEDNYGNAGEDYITAIIEFREKNPDYIRARYRYWIDQIYNVYGNGKSFSDKQVSSLAVMFLADELSEKFIFHDGLGMCKNPELYVGQAKDISEVEEGQRAYEYLWQCVYRDINMFEPQNRDIDDNTYHGKVGGSIETISSDEIMVNIMVEQFRRYMNEGDFSEKVTLDWIIKKQLLYGYEKGKGRSYPVTIIRNYSPRCYRVLKRKDKQEQFIPVSEEETLPFDD